MRIDILTLKFFCYMHKARILSSCLARVGPEGADSTHLRPGWRLWYLRESLHPRESTAGLQAVGARRHCYTNR